MKELKHYGTQIRDRAEFFSDVLEIPLKEFQHKVKLDKKEGWKSLTEIKLGDEYYIRIACKPDDDFESINYQSSFGHKGKILSQERRIVSGWDTNPDPKNLGEIKLSVGRQVLSELGGVSTETAFMNYEDYSFRSLINEIDENGYHIEKKEDHSYFQSAYLLLMTHQKELGKEMPPILGKSDLIYEAKDKGNVGVVKSTLENQIHKMIERQYRTGCIVHAKAEAEEIIKQVKKRKKHFDQSIPLSEKWEYSAFIPIDGKLKDKKYNILVVEDFGDHTTCFGSAGILGKKIADILEKDGNYGCSFIIPEVALHGCMELCATGQIDAIIFDGGNGNGFEGIYFGLEVPENVEVDAKNQRAGLNMENFDPSLVKKNPELRIKHHWADRIEQYCNRYGQKMPPHYVIDEDVLNTDLESIVKGVLLDK